MLAKFRTSIVFASKTDDERSPSKKRQSHRLSKPPTNRSSSNLLATTAQEPSHSVDDSPISASNGFDAVNISLSAEWRSRQDARDAVRSHLFGESSVSSPRLSEEEEQQTKSSRRGSLIGNMKDRLSRSGSLVSQLASSKGSTTNLPGIASNPRLSLVAESISADPHISREWILNRVESDEWTAMNYTSSPVQEEHNERIAPIRRRSLLTPGIATRIPSDILRKPPPPDSFITQADRDYYFDPRYPENSPLSQLEALDLAEEEWTMPAIRTATPCELDYSHLCGLRPGTLRITNGAVSPTPSDMTTRITIRRSNSDMAHYDGNFHAAGNWTEEDDDRGRAPTRDGDRVADRSLSFEGSHYRLASQPLQAQHSMSSLRYEHYVDAEGPSDDESDHPDFSTPKQSRRPASPLTLSITHPDRTSVMAEEYMSELPMSPISFERSPSLERSASPCLNSTSKASEFDDHLFDDEGVFTSSIRNLDTSVMEDSYATATPHQVHVEVHDIAPCNDAKTAKPLSKADSGYSSTASLRSFKSERRLRKQEAQRLSGEPIFESSPPIPDQDTMVISPQSAYMNKPAHPQEQSVHVISTRQSPSPPHVSLVKPETPNAHSLATLSSLHQSTDSIATLSSTTSAPVANMKHSKKLQKGRPLSQPPPIRSIKVQGYREMVQAHIPPVPSDVASRLAVRSSQIPELDHTFTSLHHTRSNSSLSDLPFPPVTIRFPDNDPDIAHLPSGITMDQTSAMASATGSPYRSYTSAKSLETRRSSFHQRSRVEPDLAATYATIRDFGTVTESLGRGPYDAARTSMPPKLPRGANNRHLSQPHNISSGMPRAKSTTGMAAGEAAKLARCKSRTLAEGRELTWEEKQRLFDDRGGIPGKKIRPKSMVGAPPMPSMPSPEQVSEIEKRRVSVERPTLARPFSAKRAQSEVYVSKPTRSVKEQKSNPGRSSQIPSVESSKSITAVSWPAHSPARVEFKRRPAHAEAIDFHKSWEPHREAWKARRKSAGAAVYRRQSSGEEERAQFFRANPIRAPEMPAVERLEREPTLPAIEPRVGQYDGAFGYGYGPGSRAW